MKFSPCVTICDGYQCDDDFANDDGEDGLPDGDASGNEGATELPVGESNLIDSPERYKS